ncbi:PAS and ANTAR domain-containing protein [Mycobacteroides abscessus]|nr:PAS and ANTAR domain-containing protein [Mycobacteroides abscessus]MDM2424614.1 PAS and ANTAR domain-containing protein [Mycobacteroides abscessus]MDM2429846.1 PAS and ANTAR domain-containing protein [Mycobacteroides abscessus]MDM2434186.1 PAS and ANTAR domain-containing protein [Mycobacteroides abscessus]MDM2442775.1 PAS and ANTAR domain-containing protein [Mycobacteroides abscessus]
MQGGLGPVPVSMGWFRFYFDEQRWEWSPEVARLHGYQPGAVMPTTELVLSHKHPEDREKVADLIDAITHTRGALSSRHRIIDTQGAVHWVVVIGDRFFDDTGAVVGTRGFYVDVTPAELTDTERRTEELVSARVAEITGNRAAIEQVKGMLMLVYDVNEDVAFGLLTWLSQQHNVKLRALAEQLSGDLRGVATFDQAAFDHVLLTAHQRIRGPGRTPH